MQNMDEYEARREEYGRDNLKEWYWLTSVPGIGQKRTAVLRTAFDNIAELYNIEKKIGKEKAVKHILGIFEEAGVRGANVQALAGMLLDDNTKH